MVNQTGGLLPSSSREWAWVAALGVVAFVLGAVTGARAVNVVGTGMLVVGWAGWFVTAHLEARRSRR